MDDSEDDYDIDEHDVKRVKTIKISIEVKMLLEESIGSS